MFHRPNYTFTITGINVSTAADRLAAACKQEWQHAPHDPGSLQRLASRLAHTAHNARTISYAELVRDIDFQVPLLNKAHPYRPNFSEGSVIRSADLALVEEFLTYLSLHSFKGGGVIASALLRSPGRADPNAEFLRLARQLHARTPDLFPDYQLWQCELELLYAYFARSSER